MTSLSIFRYCFMSKFELPYPLSNLAKIIHRGQFFKVLISNLKSKVQYEYVLSKKKNIFTKKLKILPRAP